ncbi:hypothetical protein D3C75_971590 [compost metagenome]
MDQHADQCYNYEHQRIQIGNLKAEADSGITNFEPFKLIPTVIPHIPQALKEDEKRQYEGQQYPEGSHQNAGALHLFAESDQNEKGHQRKHGNQPRQM